MRLSGPVAPTTGSLSEEATAALKCGDIQSLLDIHHRRWGNLVMMADDPDDDGDDDGDEPDDDDTGSGGDSGSDKDKADDDGDTISRAEYDALMKRMKAADKRAADAEKKIREQDDAKKDDLTKAQDRVAELEQAVEDSATTIRTLRLENAFLTSNKHSWHDPEVALDLAQRKKYVDEDIIDDDGTVDKVALKKALDRLAKECSYLVAAPKKQKDDADGDEPDQPSGQSAGKRSKNNDDSAAKQQQLRSRFPVLNR